MLQKGAEGLTKSICMPAGINNCTASGKSCGPTHGQLQDGQSYLCVSFDAQNLDSVAKVLQYIDNAALEEDMASHQ